jgi:DNA-binding MarR family transcriptional regulator
MPKDDRLIYLISTAQQKLWTYLKGALSAAGILVTPAQAGILFLLEQKDGQSMSELSQTFSIDNSTITGLVDRLEKSGLVRRNASLTDRRIFRIYLTPRGVKESNRARAVIRKVNEEIKVGFSKKEIETLKRILDSFFEKFSKG